jgi:hypothetical protein
MSDHIVRKAVWQWRKAMEADARTKIHFFSALSITFHNAWYVWGAERVQQRQALITGVTDVYSLYLGPVMLSLRFWR